VPLLVARNVEKLEEVRAEIVAAGGTAYVYAADLSDMESVDRLVERVLADHRNVDMLVNNAGRSIRARSRSATTASTTSNARCSSTTSARSS
jgi:short-subunit dehydrogenase